MAELSRRVKAIVVPELNMGQMVIEVARAAAGRCGVIPVGHCGGGVHAPETILSAVESAVSSGIVCAGAGSRSSDDSRDEEVDR